MDGDDLLELPNDVWDNEQNQSGVTGDDAAKVARQSGPPSTACMSVKLIFNNGWVQSAGNGNVALADQRARDVFAEANNIGQELNRLDPESIREVSYKVPSELGEYQRFT